MQDYIHNGVGYGEVGSVFGSRDGGFDIGRFRPYLDDKTGKPCVTINTGRLVRDDKAPGGVRELRVQRTIQSLAEQGIYIPVGNAVTMRRDDYREIDRNLMEITRKEQVFAGELKRINTVTTDAMKKLVYDYETVSDYLEAVVDMDPMTVGRNDAPLVARSGVPLPIIHVDITRGARQLGVWSNGTPTLTQLDQKTAGIKMGEKSEKIAIGMETGIQWGDETTGPTPYRATTGSSASIVNKVYGAATHPARYTKTNMTAPTGLNPQVTYQEVLGLIQTMLEANFKGPFVLYHSLDWNQYMDNDYAWTNGSGWAVNPTTTLRKKLEQIADISRVVRVPFFTNTFSFLLVPDDSRYVGMIVGMPQTTVQWPSKGGMQQNWKTMMCEVPYLKFDYNGYLPVYHATTT